ncbi:hypothetical protein [Rathayibacter sp. PhB127]|uniref:hypothetical protein n=1 Tax=Rathayibacter sp. PhB127 TaxID=2485176 RepID=UPI0011CDC1DF|nr:hypothetical protein [Rathayibacter sp. PhB127]
MRRTYGVGAAVGLALLLTACAATGTSSGGAVGQAPLSSCEPGTPAASDVGCAPTSTAATSIVDEAPATTEPELLIDPSADACASLIDLFESREFGIYQDHAQVDINAFEIGGNPGLPAPDCAIQATPSDNSHDDLVLSAFYFSEDADRQGQIMDALLSVGYENYTYPDSFSQKIDETYWSVAMGNTTFMLGEAPQELIDEIGGGDMLLFVGQQQRLG